MYKAEKYLEEDTRKNSNKSNTRPAEEGGEVIGYWR